MKKTVLSLTMLMMAAVQVGASEQLLTDGWRVQSSASKKSYDAQVPSTVMGTLTRNGLYKGILEGRAYKQYDAKTFQLGSANSQDTFLGKKAYSNTYLAYSGDTEVKGFIIGRAFGKTMVVFHFCASYEDYTAMESVMRYMLKSVQLVEEE